MESWSHGYNVSQGYTFGFFRETSPDWLRAAVRLAGFRAPGDEGAAGRFRYLELGSGQGVGLSLLAAAYPEAEFVGVDFNPEHIAHSRELTAAADLGNATFLEADFAALASAWPDALGQFDFVVLHGIYSWVPEAVRAALVRCLDRAVAPGGLVYVSYNAMPGWASSLPLQHMLRRIELAGGSTGEQAIADGIALFEGFAGNNAAITNALPTLNTRVASLKGHSASYLVQEYLNADWHPLWVSQVAGELAGAKLGLVATATFAESLLPGALPEGLRTLITARRDPLLRQEVTDCAINQAFRRDIYCRGARRQFSVAPVPDILLHRLRRADGGALTIETTYGELILRPTLYGPILAALEAGPRTPDQIAAGPALAGEDRASVVQAITLLVHGGLVGIGGHAEDDHAPAHRLNRVISRAAAIGAPYGHVAAPVLGSALPARDIDLLMLDAIARGIPARGEDLAAPLLASLDRLGRRLSLDGNALEGADAQARARLLADEFAERILPDWRRFGVID